MINTRGRGGMVYTPDSNPGALNRLASSSLAVRTKNASGSSASRAADP